MSDDNTSLASRVCYRNGRNSNLRQRVNFSLFQEERELKLQVSDYSLIQSGSYGSILHSLETKENKKNCAVFLNKQLKYYIKIGNLLGKKDIPIVARTSQSFLLSE